VSDDEPVRIPITDIFDLHTVPPRDVKPVIEAYLDERTSWDSKPYGLFMDAVSERSVKSCAESWLRRRSLNRSAMRRRKRGDGALPWLRCGDRFKGSK